MGSSVKNLFLKYVEMQKAAESAVRDHGPNDDRTRQAFVIANELKAQVIAQLEKIK